MVDRFDRLKDDISSNMGLSSTETSKKFGSSEKHLKNNWESNGLTENVNAKRVSVSFHFADANSTIDKVKNVTSQIRRGKELASPSHTSLVEGRHSHQTASISSSSTASHRKKKELEIRNRRTQRVNGLELSGGLRQDFHQELNSPGNFTKQLKTKNHHTEKDRRTKKSYKYHETVEKNEKAHGNQMYFDSSAKNEIRSDWSTISFEDHSKDNSGEHILSQKKQHNAVIHACDDKTGKCLFHPHIKLRKKAIFGVLGGWVDVVRTCPDCEAEDVKRLNSIGSSGDKSVGEMSVSGRNSKTQQNSGHSKARSRTLSPIDKHFDTRKYSPEHRSQRQRTRSPIDRMNTRSSKGESRQKSTVKKSRRLRQRSRTRSPISQSGHKVSHDADDVSPRRARLVRNERSRTLSPIDRSINRLRTLKVSKPTARPGLTQFRVGGRRNIKVESSSSDDESSDESSSSSTPSSRKQSSRAQRSHRRRGNDGKAFSSDINKKSDWKENSKKEDKYFRANDTRKSSKLQDKRGSMDDVSDELTSAYIDSGVPLPQKGKSQSQIRDSAMVKQQRLSETHTQQSLSSLQHRHSAPTPKQLHPLYDTLTQQSSSPWEHRHSAPPYRELSDESSQQKYSPSKSRHSAPPSNQPIIQQSPLHPKVRHSAPSSKEMQMMSDTHEQQDLFHSKPQCPSYATSFSDTMCEIYEWSADECEETKSGKNVTSSSDFVHEGEGELQKSTNSCVDVTDIKEDIHTNYYYEENQLVCDVIAGNFFHNSNIQSIQRNQNSCVGDQTVEDQNEDSLPLDNENVENFAFDSALIDHADIGIGISDVGNEGVSMKVTLLNVSHDRNECILEPLHKQWKQQENMQLNEEERHLPYEEIQEKQEGNHQPKLLDIDIQGQKERLADEPSHLELGAETDVKPIPLLLSRNKLITSKNDAACVSTVEKFQQDSSDLHTNQHVSYDKSSCSDLEQQQKDITNNSLPSLIDETNDSNQLRQQDSATAEISLRNKSIMMEDNNIFPSQSEEKLPIKKDSFNSSSPLKPELRRIGNFGNLTIDLTQLQATPSTKLSKKKPVDSIISPDGNLTIDLTQLQATPSMKSSKKKPVDSVINHDKPSFSIDENIKIDRAALQHPRPLDVGTIKTEKVKTFDTSNLPWTGRYGESGMYTGVVNEKYQPHGKGTMIYDNGEITKGHWKNGHFLRECRVYSSSEEDNGDDNDDGDLSSSMINLNQSMSSKYGCRDRSTTKPKGNSDTTISPSLPKLAYKIGDSGKDCDMILEKEEALEMISKLKVNDSAFIRRSDGNWTFAVVKALEKSADGKSAIRFTVNENNSSKSYGEKYWRTHIRPRKVAEESPSDIEQMGEREGRTKKRDPAGRVSPQSSVHSEPSAPSDKKEEPDNGIPCPPRQYRWFGARSRSRSRRRAVSFSPMRTLCSISESDVEDDDSDSNDDKYLGSEMAKVEMSGLENVGGCYTLRGIDP